MNLAILFWCYKNPEVCRDRLELLRQHNPERPIYVLFGGEPDQAGGFRVALEGLHDDFYVFTGAPPEGSEELLASFRGGAYWKYFYGDLLIASWYRERGHELAWDTVVVVQWDMLVFGSLDEVFRGLKPGEILLSGLRPIREVEEDWGWVSPHNPPARSMYEDFLQHVRERYGFQGDPRGCLAIVLALPRAFLEPFSRIEEPQLGFIEYRLPIYAQAFGIPFCTDHDFHPWWGAVDPLQRNSTLRARPAEIEVPTILKNLRREDGARVFHPYWRRVPRGFFGWFLAFGASLPRLVSDVFRGRAGERAWRRAQGQSRSSASSSPPA